MQTHEIIIKLVYAGLLIALGYALKTETNVVLWFAPRPADSDVFKFNLAHGMQGNWYWQKPQVIAPTNCIAKPHVKSKIRVEVRAAGCSCTTIINGKEIEYSAKSRKEILRFVKSRATLFAGYDLHFTGDATPATVTVNNTHRGRATKKQLEATPQKQIAPEILEIAQKIELWANKNGIDANAILSGQIPTTPEKIMLAISNNTSLEIPEVTDVLSDLTPHERIEAETVIESEKWFRKLRGVYMMAAQKHPNRATKLEKSLNFQIESFESAIEWHTQRGKTVDEAANLWFEAGKRACEAKISR